MTDTRGMQLADYIRDLTEPHTHAEDYTIRSGKAWVGQRHITRTPSLLAQLWANDVPSNAAEEGPRPEFTSKPAARLDALDTAVRIDLDAARWLRDLGEDDPVDTVVCLRRLHALAVSAHPATRRAITSDVRRWWIRARVVTGWDAPAWTPDATCPQCGNRGTLRIRLADQIGTCVEDACRATWDQTNIGLLADHVRLESEEAEKPTIARRGACWCPVPKPVVPDLSRLCPECGSARCMQALQVRLVDTLRAQRAGA